MDDCYRLVKVMPDRICQRADGVVEDEQVLVLIFPKREHKSVQNKAEVRHQLCASLLLQSRKRTDGEQQTHKHLENCSIVALKPYWTSQVQIHNSKVYLYYESIS